jgi:hypothetical protein
MDNRIAFNFNKVYEEIKKTYKKTTISKTMGYTTTAQLNNIQTGAACISTTAIMNLVKNFHVNPTFLFTGEGNMFLAKNTRYKVWIEIERIETDADGNETYHSEDNPVGLSYEDSIEDAVELQTIINDTFGRIT